MAPWSLDPRPALSESLHTSELSQGCFLGQAGWGGDGQSRRYSWSGEGVRGLLRSITQRAHPQTSWVSKTEKQTPSWVVLPQMAPQSPQKENKGSDPNFASVSGEQRAQGGGRLVEHSLRPCLAGTLAQSAHFPLGGEDTVES